MGDVKYQKIQGILIGQIDQKIAERTTVMQQLNRKIKEQKKHVVVTGSRIGRRHFPF